MKRHLIAQLDSLIRIADGSGQYADLDLEWH